MTAATFHTRTAVPETHIEHKPGFCARFVAAMMEARLRAAMRELNRHRHLVPQDLLKKSGYTATVTDDGRFPFTR